MSLATGGRKPVMSRSLARRLPDIATQADFTAEMTSLDIKTR